MLNKIRQWLAETHGSQFELIRHCLSQQLVNELVSSEQVRRLVITVLCVVGCVEPLIVRLYIPKYAYLQSLATGDLYLAAVHADRLFFIAMSMMAAGMVTVVQWQSLFPSRQDYLALKALPVRLYQIFVARFLASTMIVAVVLVDLNLAASLAFPLLTSGRWQTLGVRYVVAQAVATMSAGCFVYLALIALLGVLMNVLPPRLFDRLSVWIQVLLAGGLLAATRYVLDIPNWHKSLAARPWWITIFPPAWFLGLYETVLGTADSYFRSLGERALFAIGIAFLLVVATYFVSYCRHAARALEQARPRWKNRVITGYAAAGLRVVIRQSRELAAFVFALQTLHRSRRHRLLVVFAAVLALLLLGQAAADIGLRRRHGSPEQVEALLALPLVIVTIVISTLGYVFQQPSEVEANWIFRLAEHAGRLELLHSVERLLMVCGLLPVLLLTLPIEWLALGWMRALSHLALAAVLMLLLIEFRLNGWHKIPFTCSYVPGRRNFWQIAGAYAFVFGAVIPTIAYFEARLPSFVVLGCAAALSVGYAKLRSARLRQWEIVPLLFDESDEPLIRTVQLHRD